ncbi:MFS transporter [Saccharopolyspora elongata]|uniref:MFS transporter n=1 Tax=Saccharopolyspora elongata TaxID=2530387 RepID=UPI0022A6D9AC|nr:MFS transporter [Saccharopolyspora elongata]
MSLLAAGLLVTAYALGMIVGGPVVTVVTARLARKPLIVGLIAVSLAGNLGSAVAPNYPVLLVARFVAGLVVATFFAVAIATAVSTAATRPDRAPGSSGWSSGARSGPRFRGPPRPVGA